MAPGLNLRISCLRIWSRRSCWFYSLAVSDRLSVISHQLQSRTNMVYYRELVHASWCLHCTCANHHCNCDRTVFLVQGIHKRMEVRKDWANLILISRLLSIVGFSKETTLMRRHTTDIRTGAAEVRDCAIANFITQTYSLHPRLTLSSFQTFYDLSCSPTFLDKS